MNKYMSLLLAAILALTMPAGGFSAQGEESFREKRESRIEILTMWRLMEELDLNKKTADSIFEIRKKYLKRRKSLIQEINQDLQALKKALGAPEDTVTENEINDMLQEIRSKRNKLMSLWSDQYEEVSKLLTIRQQARLVLFMKEFRKELRRLRDIARNRPLRPLRDRKPRPGEASMESEDSGGPFEGR